jgi:integrase
MRGHITKRGKNSYSIVIPLGTDPATGKRKQQWVSVKGTKKEAERKLAELLHQLDTGTFMKPGKATLADFLERWLKDYADANLAPRTAEGYETIIRQHLIPKLGSVPLTQLKPEHIQKYYAETLANGRCNGKGGLSSTTLRHHHMALHKALKCAVKWGLIGRNPSDAVDAPRCQNHEMHTLNEDGMRSLLEAAQSTPYYALFYLALYTGMRRSELLGLRWCDVDLILGQVSVTRGLHYLRDGSIVFRSPKTAASRRTVALPPSAILMLRDHRAQQETIHAMSGKPADEEGLVFSHPDGKPLLPNTVTHAWIKLARGTGLAGIRLHDARHTHASLMLKQGVHPKVVQERLGHSSIAITLDTYSHVAPGLQQAAARRFDEGLISKTQSGVASSGVPLAESVS